MTSQPHAVPEVALMSIQVSVPDSPGELSSLHDGDRDDACHSAFRRIHACASLF